MPVHTVPRARLPAVPEMVVGCGRRTCASRLTDIAAIAPRPGLCGTWGMRSCSCVSCKCQTTCKSASACVVYVFTHPLTDAILPKSMAAGKLHRNLFFFRGLHMCFGIILCAYVTGRTCVLWQFACEQFRQTHLEFLNLVASGAVRIEVVVEETCAAFPMAMPHTI